MKYLYKYTQNEYQYDKFVTENINSTHADTEFEITDTNAFAYNRYFDIYIEMTKDAKNEEELLFRITAHNCGKEAAPLHVIPQVWFRNAWAWGVEAEKDNAVQ